MYKNNIGLCNDTILIAKLMCVCVCVDLALYMCAEVTALFILYLWFSLHISLQLFLEPLLLSWYYFCCVSGMMFYSAVNFCSLIPWALKWFSSMFHEHHVHWYNWSVGVLSTKKISTVNKKKMAWHVCLLWQKATLEGCIWSCSCVWEWECCWFECSECFFCR